MRQLLKTQKECVLSQILGKKPSPLHGKEEEVVERVCEVRQGLIWWKGGVFDVLKCLGGLQS